MSDKNSRGAGTAAQLSVRFHVTNVRLPPHSRTLYPLCVVEERIAVEAAKGRGAGTSSAECAGFLASARRVGIADAPVIFRFWNGGVEGCRDDEDAAR